MIPTQSEYLIRLMERQLVAIEEIRVMLGILVNRGRDEAVDDLTFDLERRG